MSVSASSAWTGTHEISSIKAVSTGDVYVTLSGFTNNDAEVSCESNVLVLKSGGAGFETRYSAVLSAHMAGKEASFSYYGCSGNHINISSVVVPKN